MIGLEKKAQAQWAEEKLFEINAPFEVTTTSSTTTPPSSNIPCIDFNPEDAQLTPSELREKYPKWLGTFPFPYMNGSLHLGHGFTISKVEVGILIYGKTHLLLGIRECWERRLYFLSRFIALGCQSRYVLNDAASIF